MPTINVSGKVGYETGEGAPGVVVAVSWAVADEPQGPAQALTDADGNYSVSFTYNTHTKSSWIRGDICREKVTQVSISAYKQGYFSEPVLARLPGSETQVNLMLTPEPQ